MTVGELIDGLSKFSIDDEVCVVNSSDGTLDNILTVDSSEDDKPNEEIVVRIYLW